MPGFVGATNVALVVPCTYDLEVTAARYFDALAGGAVPLLLLFSGTVFYEGPKRVLVNQIPTAEAHYRMPVALWRHLVDAYFPDTAWLRLSRDTMHELQRFRSRHALPSWERAFDLLLARAGEERP